jgi:hypothetical protein
VRLLRIATADAQRVIDGRPYQRKSELLDRKIISATTCGRIEAGITTKARSVR